MNLGRTLAVAKKEFLHVARDPRSLMLAFFIPLFMLFMFGYALTLDVDRVPLLVWDSSNTPQSRDFVEAFRGSRYFAVSEGGGGYRQIEDAIERREILMALVIPHSFAGALGKAGGASAQLIVDGSDSNTATIALGYARAVAAGYSTSIALDEMKRFSGGQPPTYPLDFRLRVWFNEELKSKNYIIPGLIGVIMMIITALLTSLTVAREWETGTMEQLVATPIRGSELLVGKLAPYFVIGMADMVLAVLMGEYLFHVPLRGSLLFLFCSATVFFFGVLFMGIFISVAAKGQLLASQIAIVSTYLPAFLLSGFMFSIENMPPPVRAITRVIPARYFVTILKSVYLKGLGLAELWREASVLALFSAVMVFLAITRFKKKIG